MTTDASRVEVLPVVRGSIVWLHNVDGLQPTYDDDGIETDPGFLDHLLDTLRQKVGHNQFVVLCTEGEGIVEVVGEDEIVARVRKALEA